tara:strand:- start:152 stop:1846 length:1695 start_codon:yes stop_codon:yes gene_type:complete
MYGIMSGLEPRGYANGDLVQKALQLGVQPFGMSDEEIMQAISQKQQVDDMSGASGDIGKGLSALNKNVKDYVFDYTDPLEYATLPFLAPKLAMKGKKVFDAVRGSGGALSKNLRGIGAYIGTDILARDVMGYKNPFAKDAQDEAAEDLAEMQDNEFIDFEEDGGISLIDPDKPMETGMSSEEIAKEIGDKKTPLDKMKGLAALAEFAGQLGTSPGDTPQMTMTGPQFFGTNTFKPPGVMRMADGGIAVPGFRKGIAAFIKDKGKEVLKNRRKKKADKAEAKAASQEPSTSTALVPYERADSYLPREFAYLGTKGKEIGRKLQDVFSKKENQARGVIYGGIPLAGVGLGALLSDDKPPPPPPKIATGGGDKDVLDGDSSLRDFNYSKALARAQAAGRTEPTFVDYVASFPASYTDKLGKDPEFAKQMMAGFVAMMTPTEGIVERSGVADFAGGVMAEQARQEGEVPDQIKLMQALSKDPELLDAYKKFSKSTQPYDALTEQKNRESVFRSLQEMIFGPGFDEDEVPVDTRTKQPADSFTVYSEFLSMGGDSDALIALKENYADKV